MEATGGTVTIIAGAGAGAQSGKDTMMTIAALTVEAEAIGMVMQMVIGMKEVEGEAGGEEKKKKKTMMIGATGLVEEVPLLGKGVLRGEQRSNNGIESGMDNDS